MKRVLARELTLVNWKGVFYERYLLDPNVTALEGDNGAGKTTVMIAAYLVLLPDLSRLRFTNLGETGATGGDKGIWGRLGQLARPSYAALTLRLGDGTELIAGVVIVRKAEPTLELHPFLIEGLPREARARDYLLRVTEEHDEIPTVEEVEQAVAEAGAKLERFATSKAYFARLFEMGINPMRLASDEERNKYNDMLRTSMTGGISRALTSELRSFVFKQETGLSDTLGRMRGNLAACRQTRTEVVESRQLERHISGIYDAGLGMFEAALLASAAEAAENAAELSLAKRAEDEAETECALQQTLLAEAAARKSSLDPQLEGARSEAQRAKERVEKYQRALVAAERVAELRRELEAAEGELGASREQQERTTALRTSARQRWGELQSAVLRSAQGLANLQTGLEELHQRAHAHRRIVEQLSLGQSALLRSGFDATRLQGLDPKQNDRSLFRELIAELQREAAAALLATDEERASRARLLESARVHREEHERARDALLTIAGETEVSAAPSLIELAREQLSRLGRLDTLAALAGRWQSELETWERRAKRWGSVRERVLELDLGKDIDGRGLAKTIATLDAEVRGQREAAREAAWQAREFENSVEQLAGLRAEAEAQSLRFDALSQAATSLREAGIDVEPRNADWDALADELEGRTAALERRVAKLTTERGDALAQAARFEAAEETPNDELCRIRDLVSGEFLSRRFEELEPDTARLTEARLGPLRDAIVVEDLAQAEQLLSKEPRTVTDVWLVSAAADLSAFARPELVIVKDVSVPTASGVRVSRVPDQASLGRVARARRAEALRKLALSRGKMLEEEERGLRQLRSLARDLQRLRDERRLFSAGNPSERVVELDAQSETAKRAATERHAGAREASERAARASLRVEALRPLLADAQLLDDASPEPRVAELRAKLLEATTAQAELERVNDARPLLQRLLDVLRTEPPSAEALAAWPAEQRALDEKRDALFAAVETLAASAQQLHALDFAEASAALERQTATVPELEQQHQTLVVAAAEAEAAHADFEARWNVDTEGFQEHKARSAALLAHIERALQELREAGHDAPEPAGLDGLVREAASAQQLVSALEDEGRGLLARSALAEERSATSTARRDGAQARARALDAKSAPAQRAWQTLQTRARELRLALPSRGGELGDNSQRHWARARSLGLLLNDRLQATGEATELLDQLPTRASDDAMASLAAWLEVRAWLHKRLPAQVADVAEPLDALMRLRDDLTTLEGRLRHQETELRGASEDVARSIEAQIRRSTRQVRRINQYLEGIRFGSVHAIRIRVGRVEKMTQVLEALRDGSAQELLFQSQLPFEAALEEIFHRYGGGRGGGQRILDYREYIDLQVEVQRRVADSPWETANPTRVSTGEAIGVGAALMMVILTEWERDANLMRGSRPFGSLRFLFLDEANRLSQDNLGVLFELCQSLQLQLLIAAPEVARASGNTTYRLVRRLTEDGSEEVLVTGRRAGLPDEGVAEQA